MELERYTSHELSKVQNQFKANDALFTALVMPVADACKIHYVAIMNLHGQLRRNEEEFRHACRVAETYLSDFAKFTRDQAIIDETQRRFLRSVSGRAVVPPSAPSNEPAAQNNLLQERWEWIVRLCRTGGRTEVRTPTAFFGGRLGAKKTRMIDHCGLS
jgi:hypothetical protein